MSKAIDFAVENKADMISLDFEFMFYSFKIFEACKRAYFNNTIVIVAGEEKEWVFHADNEYVIKIINDDNNYKENIKSIDNKTYKVKKINNNYIKELNNIKLEISENKKSNLLF